MDAFSSYNQISMDPIGQGKTSFVTGQGTYCYRVSSNALRIEECKSHLPKAGEQDVPETNWNIYGGIYRRHAGKIGKSRALHNPFSQGVLGPEKLQYEVKPSQMCFRSLCREVLGFYSQ